MNKYTIRNRKSPLTKQLRKLVKRSKLSVRGLAEKIGMDHRKLSGYVYGNCPTTEMVLDQVTNAINGRPQVMPGRKYLRPVPGPVNCGGTNQLDSLLEKMVDSLPVSGRIRLAEYALSPIISSEE